MACHVESDSDLFRYINTNKYKYNNVKCIIIEQLMMSELNKYKGMIASVKCNTIPHEQDQIIALSFNIKKIKDYKLKNS